MLKSIKYFLLLVIVLFFTTCKKYPENNLWFKNPAKIIARGGLNTWKGENPWKLDFYSVDGIDSTNSSFLNIYKEEGVVIFIDGNVRKGTYKFQCSDVLYGFWDCDSPKKVMHFNFGVNNFKSNSLVNANSQNQRNIFMYSHLPSKILKLTKEQFWIQLEFNSISYEIHFK